MKTVKKQYIRINLPNVSQQYDWSCGAAVVLSLLLYYGKGPLNEEIVGKKLKMDETGTDPYQIKRVLKNYGLKFIEYRGMTIEQLRQNVDKGRPVLIMLQAWGKPEKYSRCKNGCKDGHWLIAIGYDKYNIYFEDPVLNISRGYIKVKELDARWHDYEFLNEKDRTKYHSDHFGLVIHGGKAKSRKVHVEEIP